MSLARGAQSIQVDANESLRSWEGGAADDDWAIRHLRGLVAAGT